MRVEASGIEHSAALRVPPQLFTPKATKNGAKLDGNLAAKYVIGGGMETEVTLATSGVLKGTFEAANLIAKGLVVKVDPNHNPYPNPHPTLALTLSTTLLTPIL